MTTKLAPLCRYCGRAIAKKTRTYWIKPEPTEYTRNGVGPYLYGTPATKADVQRMVNGIVLSVSYEKLYRDGEVVGRRLSSAGVWDGESYVDKFFCTGAHAQALGYYAACAGKATADYNAAVQKQLETERANT